MWGHGGDEKWDVVGGGGRGTETQSEGDGGTQMKHGDMEDAEVTGTQRTEDVGW